MEYALSIRVVRVSAELWLYAISVLHNFDLVSGILFWMSFGTIIILSLSLFAIDAEYECNSKLRTLSRINRTRKNLIIIMLISLPFVLLVPSQKTMYAMLATNVIGKSDIPQRVLNIIDDKLKEYEKYDRE